MEKRYLPSLLDEPIKLLFFDKEDGIVFMSSIVIFMVFLDNLLTILLISTGFMVIVNRLKAGKPKGYIIQIFYRFYNFTLPIQYKGKRVRMRV